MNINTAKTRLANAETRISAANESGDKELLQYWRGRADSLREMIADELSMREAVRKDVDESLAERRTPANAAA